MPRVTRKNWIKAKVWGEKSTMEIEGNLDELIPHTLFYIPSHTRRAAVIAKMQEFDRKMTERENNPAPLELK